MIQLIKRLKSNQKIQLGLAACFIIIQVYFDMQLPLYFAKIISLMQNMNLNGGELNRYWPGMFLCLVSSFLSSAISIVLISKSISGFIAELRVDLFEKVQCLSQENIAKLGVSSLVTRCTSDVQNIQMILFTGFQAIIKVPVVSIWVYIKIAQYGLYWQLTVLVTIILCIIVIALSIILAAPYTKYVQSLTDGLNKITLEKLQGIDVIRSFNAQEEVTERFKDTNSQLSYNTYKSQIPSLMMLPGVNFIMNAMDSFVYIVCGLAIVSHPIELQGADFANLMSVIPYALQLMIAFMALVQVLFTFPRARVSAIRIKEVLDMTPTIVDGKGANGNSKGVIEFKNVSFTFPGAKTEFLKNVSFSCESGKVLAIIGSIGSGKSLLIDLIMRFYDATSGQVLVDGVDVRVYTLEQLREKISLANQKPVLFSGTIASNIAYGCEDKMSDKRFISKIGEISGAAEFVNKLPETYDAMIMRNGTNLSGGQRQRLTIARTLAKSSEIMIFDDSFSALDFKTDLKVRTDIKENFKESTKIIIGQRIGSIKDADKIVVMDKGEVVGVGTHIELLNNCETYKQIAYSQLTKEELGA
mgnify:CR=1 FL=1